MIVFALAFRTAGQSTKVSLCFSQNKLNSFVVVSSTILGIPGTDIVGIRSLGFFWLMVEVGISMVVSCLLPLWPLLQSPRGFFRPMKLSTFRSYKTTSGRASSSNVTRRSEGNFKRLYDQQTDGQSTTADGSISGQGTQADQDLEMQESPSHDHENVTIGVRKDIITSSELVKAPEQLNLGESNAGAD